jgi:peptide-methionine (S)-S-oxide reductase
MFYGEPNGDFNVVMNGGSPTQTFMRKLTVISLGILSFLVAAQPALSAGGDMQKATFAAGCFWGVQAAFDQVKGVVGTNVGYTGGHVDHPTYEMVSSHTTGHAESVEVTFDPAKVSYKQLLDIFWQIHDPTQGNRQGWDMGSNYRSAIFYHSPEQKAEAEASLKEEQTKLKKKMTTEITAAPTFWRAEDYHQKYDQKHGVSCSLPLKH